MQFKPVARKIQCLVAVYDGEAKRTRQKMIYSMERYGSPKKPDLSDLADVGTEEQREAWKAEIWAFIDKQEAEHRSHSLSVRVRGLPKTIDVVIGDLKGERAIPPEDLKAIKAAVRKLLPHLGLQAVKLEKKKKV